MGETNDALDTWLRTVLELGPGAYQLTARNEAGTFTAERTGTLRERLGERIIALELAPRMVVRSRRMGDNAYMVVVVVA